jgi:hypothetical protein
MSFTIWSAGALSGPVFCFIFAGHGAAQTLRSIERYVQSLFRLRRRNSFRIMRNTT